MWHYWRISGLATLLSLCLCWTGEVFGRVEGEAAVGRPFGVGRVTISGGEAAVDLNRVRIESADGRVFYPAVTTGVFGRLLGDVLGDPTDRPAINATVHFLFRGDEPLELTVYTPQAVKVRLEPRRENPRAFDRQLTAWWRQYSAAARRQRNEDDHPPIVQAYLLTMLSQRMGLEPPLLDRMTASQPQQINESLELLLGVERLRMDTLRSTMLGGGDFGRPADLPVPPEFDWAPLPLNNLPEVEIEPIAMHVPHNCFYVRFGRFNNYLWMNNLIEDYGGDLASMVTLRSYVQPFSDRFEKQIGLEKNVLAQLLGEQVIADVALVGRDTFGREGAAMGIMFQARNKLLEGDLRSQRRRALNREKENGATEEMVEIDGHQVSFMSTPDNRLRSFYAIDGDYHLVTTSRAMVEQFFAVSDGKGSLGASDEFRFARATMPLDRDDTVFVYFSAAFFHGLLSPHYQVELERRMKAVTDIEILQLARLAAKGEGVRGETVEDLADAGLLPRGFGKRPDGSGPILKDDRVIDSRRGARGYFLPIPDVQIEGLTEGEAARVDASMRMYATSWRRMDPLMVGIKRFAMDQKDRERIVIDGELNPLDESKYGWILSILGPPTFEMVTPAEGDIVNMQASVRGGVISRSIPPHYLFLGIQDVAPLGDLQPTGLLQTFQMIRTTPGYVGSWPKAGFLELLPFNLGGSVPDENGFSRLPLGLWRRQGAGFSVLAFDPQLLADVTPHLRVVESETEAQIRLHVGDLSQAKFRPWVNNLYYTRALQASAGNARLMHQLNQQLHVPMADAKDVAEDLLDATLIDVLGGEYQLVEEIGGSQDWQSTAWANKNLSTIPEDYEAPLLSWFRGADAHLTKLDDRLIARVELDIQRKPREPTFQLPSLKSLFGGGQKALKPKDEVKPEELPPPPLPPVENPPKLDEPKIELPPERAR